MLLRDSGRTKWLAGREGPEEAAQRERGRGRDRERGAGEGGGRGGQGGLPKGLLAREVSPPSTAGRRLGAGVWNWGSLQTQSETVGRQAGSSRDRGHREARGEGCRFGCRVESGTGQPRRRVWGAPGGDTRSGFSSRLRPRRPHPHPPGWPGVGAGVVWSSGQGGFGVAKGGEGRAHRGARVGPQREGRGDKRGRGPGRKACLLMSGFHAAPKTQPEAGRGSKGAVWFTWRLPAPPGPPPPSPYGGRSGSEAPSERGMGAAGRRTPLQLLAPCWGHWSPGPRGCVCPASLLEETGDGYCPESRAEAGSAAAWGSPWGSPWVAGLRGLWWRSPGEEEARGASRSGLDLEPGVGGGKGRTRSRALSCRHRTTCSFASRRQSVCQAEWGRVWAQKHPSGEDTVASIFQAGGMGSKSLAGSWQSWSCPCTSLCLSFQVENMGLSKGTPTQGILS